MTRREWRRACLAGLVAAATFSGGCNDILRRSIRNGVLVYISGGISSSFNEGGAVNNALTSLFTSSLFGEGGGGDNTGSTSGA